MEHSISTVTLQPWQEVSTKSKALESTSTTPNTTLEHYQRPFGNEVIWISGVIIFFFFVVGILLNFVTVIVILKYPKLRNLFAYFILSLCISDLLSALVSSLFWYRRTLGFDEWNIPRFLCKVYWSIDIMTNFVTAMHILAFSMLRFLSIKWPFTFQKLSVSTGRIFIFAIWMASIGCGFVPYVIWYGARKRNRYGNSPDARWPACTINMEWYDRYKIFQIVAYPIGIYAPMALVVIVSSVTVATVYGKPKSLSSKSFKRRKRDKQAVVQMILIVVSYLIGYIPFTAYEFWSSQSHENTPHTIQVDYYFGLVEYFFIRLSECLNPIFYNLGSAKMRTYTKHFVYGLCGKEVSLTRLSSVAQNVPARRVFRERENQLPESFS